jgi:opacity protein-like surface antigen
MKKITAILASVIVAIAFALPATAGVRIGPKLGVCVNEMHFNKDVFKTSNRTGFTGGLMIDGTIPLVGFGFDASLMYVRRAAAEKVNYDYLTIPVNLKYRFTIPAVSNIVLPFLTTGPEWSYLINHTKVAGLDSKNSCFSWGVGLGVQLVNHLQIAASYSIGITNASEDVTGNADGKNRGWAITAAWLF